MTTYQLGKKSSISSKVDQKTRLQASKRRLPGYWMDKDTSLAEKIRTLFREQGITIASILTAIGMAIGVLVEALLPRAGGGTSAGGKPPPKDEKDLKE